MAMKLQIPFLLMCVCILSALTTKGAFGVSTSAPLNRVVYEGATNTTITCKNKESFMDWSIIPYPSVGSSSGKTLTRNGKIISPFNDSFAVDHAEGTDVHTLVIYNATISPSGRAKISTTGFYQCRTNGTLTAAQLVVVRSDPICSSNIPQSTVSCTIVYGGYREFPIDAAMNWSVNGQAIPADNAKFTINSTPTEITATSVLVVSQDSDATYECATKFSKTANNRYSDVAKNAPDYYKTCTISITAATKTTASQSKTSQKATTSSLSPTTTTTAAAIDYNCEPNLKNLAVYEGQLDILMNLETDPRIVTWSVLPSSDEYNLQNIIDIGGNKNPSLVDLYDVKETGLVIKKANVTGAPISTAGLYVGKCFDSTDNVGAKLLVIRTGPQCSRTSIDTSSSGVSCNVTFADSVIHPIRPIVTWSLNGEFLSTNTLQMERIGDVLYAESTIETNGGANDNYQCEVTFDAPVEIMYPWIATNAPEFKDSCSITG